MTRKEIQESIDLLFQFKSRAIGEGRTTEYLKFRDYIFLLWVRIGDD